MIVARQAEPVARETGLPEEEGLAEEDPLPIRLGQLESSEEEHDLEAKDNLDTLI